VRLRASWFGQIGHPKRHFPTGGLGLLSLPLADARQPIRHLLAFAGGVG